MVKQVAAWHYIDKPGYTWLHRVVTTVNIGGAEIVTNTRTNNNPRVKNLSCDHVRTEYWIRIGSHNSNEL